MRKCCAHDTMTLDQRWRGNAAIGRDQSREKSRNTSKVCPCMSPNKRDVANRRRGTVLENWRNSTPATEFHPSRNNDMFETTHYAEETIVKRSELFQKDEEKGHRRSSNAEPDTRTATSKRASLDLEKRGRADHHTLLPEQHKNSVPAPS